MRALVFVVLILSLFGLPIVALGAAAEGKDCGATGLGCKSRLRSPGWRKRRCCFRTAPVSPIALSAIIAPSSE